VILGTENKSKKNQIKHVIKFIRSGGNPVGSSTSWLWKGRIRMSVMTILHHWKGPITLIGRIISMF